MLIKNILNTFGGYKLNNTMGQVLDTKRKKMRVSFANAKDIVWYGLGTSVKGVSTTTEAIEVANLDFRVVKKPLFIKTDDEGSLIQAPEAFATVRQDTNTILGTVGEKYNILQNKDAFKYFDTLIEEGKATIETAGMLGNGERIFIVAKLPNPIDIFGKEDLIDIHLIITTSHDGKTATNVMFVPVRLASNSTLNVDLGSKVPNFYKIKHTKGQRDRLQTGKEIMDLENQYRYKIEDIFQKLANTPASESDYERVIVAGLADSHKIYKDYFNPLAKTTTRFKNYVEDVLKYATYTPSQQTPATQDTLFGAYTAVTGYFQNEFDWGNDLDSKMRNIIDGRVNTKQQQAFDVAVELYKNA